MKITSVGPKQINKKPKGKNRKNKNFAWSVTYCSLTDSLVNHLLQYGVNLESCEWEREEWSNSGLCFALEKKWAQSSVIHEKNQDFQIKWCLKFEKTILRVALLYLIHQTIRIDLGWGGGLLASKQSSGFLKLEIECPDQHFLPLFSTWGPCKKLIQVLKGKKYKHAGLAIGENIWTDCSISENWCQKLGIERGNMLLWIKENPWKLLKLASADCLQSIFHRV